jgi:hypothetical protein
MQGHKKPTNVLVVANSFIEWKPQNPTRGLAITNRYM